MTIPYLAFKLDAASRAALLETCPPLHKNVKADHITLVRPGHLDLNGLEIAARVFSQVRHPRFFAYAHANGLGVDCVGVHMPDFFPTGPDRFYHVTLSVADGHRSKEANDLKDALVAIHPVVFLNGSFEVLYTSSE